MTKVFISYSHDDSRWLNRLKRHLKPLIREGYLDFWDDTQIRPGDDWQQAIRTALDTAQAAVLLISADLFASDFIDQNELPPLLASAQDKGVRVLSVILSASQFARNPGLARFQAVNSPDRPLDKMPEWEQEEVFNRLAAYLLDLVRNPSFRERWTYNFRRFACGSYRVPYFPFINSSDDEQMLKYDQVAMDRDMTPFTLNSYFSSGTIDSHTAYSPDSRCRLVSYSFDTGRHSLSLELSETSYGDYLISSANISNNSWDGTNDTWRDKFIDWLSRHRHFSTFPLTNIVGAGIFIITRDKHVVVTRHTELSHVYPGRWTFSASGVLQWGAYPHPFAEEEVRHRNCTSASFRKDGDVQLWR